MNEPFFSASWYRAAPIKPRLHPHVDVHRHRYRGHTWYVLHDHATGRVHRFTPATYLLIANMNGERTLDDIWKRAAAQLEESAPSQDEVMRLLSQLHGADLLQSDGPPETFEMLERLSKHRWSLLGRKFKNPLALTVPLWDPDRMLERMARWFRPINPWLLLVFWLALVVPAFSLLLLNASEWSANLPERVLAANNLFMLVLMFPLVKFLHELGHGIVVKIYGGTVHDAGAMLLVFMPVPYVDATSSLAFRSKYQRALVGAAGMLVELALASLAVYLWLLAEPGLIKAAAINVILIAGVSTVVVNGNPLLRFDGYYILSDLIEIPNLGGRSNRFWSSLIERHAFGVKRTQPDSVLPSERKWLLLYAPLAFAYRMVVFVGVSLFVAVEYPVVGAAIAIWSLIMTIVLPVAKMARYVVTGDALRENRVRAVGLSGAGLALVVLAVMMIPAPLSTVSEGVVWLPEEAQVRVGTSSFVKRLAVGSQTPVRKGDLLAELDEPSLAARLAAQAERVLEVETRLRGEEIVDRPKAALTRQELAAEGSEFDRLKSHAERLRIVSPRDGVFIALRQADLIGRWITEGQIVGFVASDEPRTVRAVVGQDNIDLVRDHLRFVTAKVVDRVGQTYDAAIVREVPAARNELPDKALGSNGGGRLAVDPKDNEGGTALERVFQFDVRLAPAPPDLYYGTRVLLLFKHEWEPLAYQWHRRVRQLFLSYFNA